MLCIRIRQEHLPVFGKLCVAAFAAGVFLTLFLFGLKSLLSFFAKLPMGSASSLLACKQASKRTVALLCGAVDAVTADMAGAVD